MRHPAQPFLISLPTLVEGANQVRDRGEPGGCRDRGPEDARSRGTSSLEGSFYRVGRTWRCRRAYMRSARQVCDRCVASRGQPIDALGAGALREEGRTGPTVGRRESCRRHGLLYHDGRTLDLREEIREVVLLEVPWHPLCRSGLPGALSPVWEELERGGLRLSAPAGAESLGRAEPNGRGGRVLCPGHIAREGVAMEWLFRREDTRGPGGTSVGPTGR